MKYVSVILGFLLGVFGSISWIGAENILHQISYLLIVLIATVLLVGGMLMDDADRIRRSLRSLRKQL